MMLRKIDFPNSRASHYFVIFGVLLLTLPGLLIKSGISFHSGSGAEALLFGVSLLGAAFMMSWATEVAQMDISQGFALAILALIAVLPEYAVDMVFAWKAGSDPSYSPLALANMIGANRLLIGLGWPMVLFLYFICSKKKSLVIAEEHYTEWPGPRPNGAAAPVSTKNFAKKTRCCKFVVRKSFFLVCATIYAFTIPFKGKLSISSFISGPDDCCRNKTGSARHLFNISCYNFGLQTETLAFAGQNRSKF